MEAPFGGSLPAIQLACVGPSAERCPTNMVRIQDCRHKTPGSYTMEEAVAAFWWAREEVPRERAPLNWAAI